MDQRAMELLNHGLKDIYDAEHRFADALQKMERNAHDKSLANGFRRHKEVTENQIKRLEDAFREMGETPSKESCAGARGLIQEYDSFLEEHRDGDGLLDAFAASAGLKVEHYEIASYRTLVDLAELCDLSEVSALLRQNLAEEEQAAAEMLSASARLGAKLAGAPVRKVAQRGGGDVISHAREGAMSAMGAARTVAGSVGDAIERTERRGRRATAKRRTSSTRTSSARTGSSARKTTTRAKSTATRGKAKAKSTARTSSSRKASTGGRTAKR